VRRLPAAAIPAPVEDGQRQRRTLRLTVGVGAVELAREKQVEPFRK
jgi:hypothetical protein